MDSAKIRDAIAMLDDEVPHEDARVALEQYDENPPGHYVHALSGDDAGGRVIANETGYLRLGIELMKAAHAPASEEGVVKVDLEYLTSTTRSDLFLDAFERNEPPSRSGPVSATLKQTAVRAGGGVGAMILTVLVIGVFLVGVFTILQWLIT